MKPLTARQTEFKLLVWEKIGKTFDKYPKDLVIEFVEHWTTVNDNGNKMYFEMKSITKGKWSTLGRLATFKRNQERWEKPIEKRNKLPNYFNKSLWQKLDPEKMREYKSKLQGLGWQYFTSQSGNHWLSPDNKRHWL